MTRELELFEEMKSLGKTYEELKKTTVKMIDDMDGEKGLFEKEKIRNAIVENFKDLDILENTIEEIKNKLKA